MDQTRNALLYKTKMISPQPTVKITKFSSHYNDIRSLLITGISCEMTPTLAKYAGNQPEIVFRRASSLRDKLTTSHYTKANNSVSKLPFGTSKCGNCLFYSWVLPCQTVFSQILRIAVQKGLFN